MAALSLASSAGQAFSTVKPAFAAVISGNCAPHRRRSPGKWPSMACPARFRRRLARDKTCRRCVLEIGGGDSVPFVGAEAHNRACPRSGFFEFTGRTWTRCRIAKELVEEHGIELQHWQSNLLGESNLDAVSRDYLRTESAADDISNFNEFEYRARSHRTLSLVISTG